MNKFKIYGQCLAANIVIFAIAFKIIRAIPSLNFMDVTIHGWAWAVFISTFISLYTVGRYLQSFFGALLKGSVLEVSVATATILSSVAFMIGLALALFLTGGTMPALVGYTSVWGVLGGVTIFGVAFGFAELVVAYYFPQGE